MCAAWHAVTRMMLTERRSIRNPRRRTISVRKK